MMDLDSQIADAHRQAEETEAQARLIEARIIKIPGADRMLPSRRYGAPVDAAAIGRNLSLRGLIGRKDPALAAFLGVPHGPSAAEEQACKATKGHGSGPIPAQLGTRQALGQRPAKEPHHLAQDLAQNKL